MLTKTNSQIIGGVLLIIRLTVRVRLIYITAFLVIRFIFRGVIWKVLFFIIFRFLNFLFWDSSSGGRHFPKDGWLLRLYLILQGFSTWVSFFLFFRLYDFLFLILIRFYLYFSLFRQLFRFLILLLFLFFHFRFFRFFWRFRFHNELWFNCIIRWRWG